MEANPSGSPGLKRSLSVWAAVGLSVALMAPSMAANINPQASAQTAGRAVPLTFLIAAVGVLRRASSGRRWPPGRVSRRLVPRTRPRPGSRPCRTRPPERAKGTRCRLD